MPGDWWKQQALVEECGWRETETQLKVPPPPPPPPPSTPPPLRPSPLAAKPAGNCPRQVLHVRIILLPRPVRTTTDPTLCGAGNDHRVAGRRAWPAADRVGNADRGFTLIQPSAALHRNSLSAVHVFDLWLLSSLFWGYQ